MNNVIMIVDDDPDDLDIFSNVLRALGTTHTVVLFQSASKALEYLKHCPSDFFLILCDINMPLMGGFEFRSEIDKDDDLKMKAIPFLFLSTSGNMHTVDRAYQSSIQGYFQKPTGWEETKEMFQLIIAYWSFSKQPVFQSSHTGEFN